MVLVGFTTPLSDVDKYIICERETANNTLSSRKFFPLPLEDFIINHYGQSALPKKNPLGNEDYYTNGYVLVSHPAPYYDIHNKILIITKYGNEGIKYHNITRGQYEDHLKYVYHKNLLVKQRLKKEIAQKQAKEDSKKRAEESEKRYKRMIEDAQKRKSSSGGFGFGSGTTDVSSSGGFGFGSGTTDASSSGSSSASSGGFGFGSG